MVGLVSLLGAGCGGSGSTTDMSVDMAQKADMTFFSCCGKPGDTGDATTGIGKYCMSQNDCPSGKNLVCSTLEPQKMTYFCTKPCSGTTDTTTCGTGASCTKDSTSGLFGCVPNACLSNMPAGCTN